MQEDIRQIDIEPYLTKIFDEYGELLEELSK